MYKIKHIRNYNPKGSTLSNGAITIASKISLESRQGLDFTFSNGATIVPFVAYGDVVDYGISLCRPQDKFVKCIGANNAKLRIEEKRDFYGKILFKSFYSGELLNMYIVLDILHNMECPSAESRRPLPRWAVKLLLNYVNFSHSW